MDKYKYTQSWFLGAEIKDLSLIFLDSSSTNNILEIGCYEGLSSVFFADNFLNSPRSSLTCVDPFLNFSENDHKSLLANKEELSFDHNISVCKNSEKITVYKISSDSFFEINTKTYNFIYIDGCHSPEFIKRDMNNAFKVLEKNGIMWMDDYCGGDGIEIKKVMDRFLEDNSCSCLLIHKGYQLALKKIT
jgi:predicted O-methyltransferase YrrM